MFTIARNIIETQTLLFTDLVLYRTALRIQKLLANIKYIIFG